MNLKTRLTIERELGIIEGAALGCREPMLGAIMDAVAVIDELLKEENDDEHLRICAKH